jgi:hypothetical protein
MPLMLMTGERGGAGGNRCGFGEEEEEEVTRFPDPAASIRKGQMSSEARRIDLVVWNTAALAVDALRIQLYGSASCRGVGQAAGIGIRCPGS